MSLHVAEGEQRAPTARGRVSHLEASALHALLSSGADAPPPLLLEACAVAAAPWPPELVPTAHRFPLSAIDVSLMDAKSGQPERVSGNFSLQPAAVLRKALEASGVQCVRHTVVYTQSTKNGNPDLAVAARLVWALSLAGVEHVSLFSGGLQAWVDAGHPVATHFQPPPASPVDFFEGAPPGLPFPLRPEFNASTAEVEAAVATGGALLADVRSWCEYSGGQHDYPYHLPLGRIPTARWAHWGPSTYVGGDFFERSTGVLHQVAQTERLWRDWGIDLSRSERVIFYCGSGWRSAVAWCLARLLGHDGCGSYDGGFLEWAVLDERAERHPIDRGERNSSSSSSAMGGAAGSAVGSAGASGAMHHSDMILSALHEP